MTRNLYQDREAIEYVIDTYQGFGAVLIRHGAAVPPAPLFWDICDEKGMLCIEALFYSGQNENESGTPRTNGIMCYTNNYGDPAFERHVDEMARAILLRDRNHPSIVIWSIENEIFCNLLSYQPTEKQMDDVARVRGVIEELDPTRLVGCDHEGTLNGRLQIKNKHYPGRVRDLNDDLADPAEAITINWQVRLYDQVCDSGSEMIDVPLAESRQIELTWTAPQVNRDTNFIVALEAIESGKQVFTDYRIFRAIDRGGPAAAVSETFRDDFSGGPTTGFIEYDTFWRGENGAYLQPEMRGLSAQAVPIRKHATGEWRFRDDHYPHNAHMAAIHPWTFDDLRASFDVKALAMDPRYGNLWAGMGSRLTHPEDSPHEVDRSRRTGYYVGLRRVGKSDRNADGDSTWRLFVGKVGLDSRRLEVLAEQQADPPGDTFVRVEVVMQGDEITVTALGRRIAARDSCYSSGYASLVMGPRAAAAYDNVVVGPAATVQASAKRHSP